LIDDGRARGGHRQMSALRSILHSVV
jgi:hypothetical protein